MGIEELAAAYDKFLGPRESWGAFGTEPVSITLGAPGDLADGSAGLPAPETSEASTATQGRPPSG